MQTLADLLPKIRDLGRREAIRWTNGFTTTTLSYADLYGKIAACAGYIEEHGLSKGDRVMIQAENSPEWVAVFWACIAKGVQIVPVDIAFSEHLRDRIRADSGARIVFDDKIMEELHERRPIENFSIAAISPDDVVEIVYTSGTTGEPHGIVHRHRNICANLLPFEKEIAKYRTRAAPFQPIRILDLLPLSHMFGQSLGIFIPVFLQGAVTFTTEFHSDAIARIIHRNRITVLVCVPRMLEMFRNDVIRRFHPSLPDVPLLKRLWKHRIIHSYFGWKFWAFVVGGARVDPDIEEFWARLGFAVVQGYGLTEASPVVSVNHPFSSKRGSLGKAVPGQEVKVADDGEILVRGASVAGVVDSDGWLHTGDLGEIDADGRLYYRGRKKDLIVTPDGLNVFPDDVEAVLNHFPEIVRSAVVSVHDQVHAALILAAGANDPADVIRRANDRLEAHQRIRQWSIWPDEDFPRTPSTLKIRRTEVADRIRSGRTESPEELPNPGELSSLERVELISELEARHGIAIDEREFSKAETAEDLRRLLAAHTASSSVARRSESVSTWSTWLPIRWFRGAFQILVANPLFRNRLDLTVQGLENLEAVQPPVLFAANHTSHLDTPAVFTALPAFWRNRLAPAMRAEHFRGKSFQYFLARFLYNGYLLPQEAGAVRRGMMATGEFVRRGYCPLIYPEGIRTADGQLQPFRAGVGMLAVQLRIPVVPLYIEGLFEIYSVHDSWPRRGPVRVVVGKPMRFAPDTPYQEGADRIREAIQRFPVEGL